MMMVLKTFKLSKNILICLLYILLIITTVSYQTKDEPASPNTDDKNNNPNEDIQDKTDLILSNSDNSTENLETNNNENPEINQNVLQGIFQRMYEARNNPAQKKLNENEVNNEENNTPKTNSIEHQQPVPNEEDLDNPLSQIALGLSSEPTFTEDDVLKDANEQNTDDKKTKKTKRKRKRKKNKKQLETADNKVESKLSEADNIENQQPENSINDIKLGLSTELTTTTDVELKEANDQSTLGEVELEEANNPLSQIALGLSSEPTFTENDVLKDANEQNTDDKKTKKTKRKRKRKRNKKQLETADNEAESKLSEADNIENQQPENSINDIKLGLSTELTTTTDVELKEANDQSTLGEVELEEANNPLSQIALGLSSEPTFTENDVLKDANEQNTDDKKTKKTKRKRKRKRNKKQLETADNEAESKLSEADNIENQQPENSINDIKLGLSTELTTTTDVELKEANNPLSQIALGLSSEPTFTEDDVLKDANEQNTDDKKTGKRKRNKKKQKLRTDKNIIEDIQIQDNMEINPMDIPVSPLENVEIVKIKNNITKSEEKRKKKKKIIFKDYKPSNGNIARIHCTFLGDVFKMYNKVKKRFVGHFCHSIVIGTPIILKHHQVPLSRKMKDNMEKVHPVKNESLLIVIMQYSSYSDWAKALVNFNQLVINIVHTVDQYNIDGILFSNLQPIMGQDQIDNDMMKNLITFFEELTKRKDSLKIGITIHMYSQWITSNTEFTSFDQLNELVTWYSYYTISMVKCSEDYISSGTSPLNGKESFTNALDTIKNTKIDMSKLIVGIQLFPNKNNELEAFTYEEFCSAPKKTWNKWCAAQPEDLRLKGLRLRDYSILGVQLFYMHSDDYRSTCGCYTFPLTRALLRGLLAIKNKEKCNFYTAHN